MYENNANIRCGFAACMLCTDDDPIAEARTQSAASEVFSEIRELGAANANFWLYAHVVFTARRYKSCFGFVSVCLSLSVGHKSVFY